MDARRCLRSFVALRALPPTQLDALADAFVERTCRDGERLLRSGGRASSAFLVLEGELVVIVERDGADHVLARLGPGSLVGHVGLFDQLPAASTVRAAGEARVGQLGAGGFRLLTGARAEVAYAFQRAIAEQVAADTRGLVASARRAAP